MERTSDREPRPPASPGVPAVVCLACRRGRVGEPRASRWAHNHSHLAGDHAIAHVDIDVDLVMSELARRGYPEDAA